MTHLTRFSLKKLAVYTRDFCTVTYQVFVSNTNNLHTVLWFQIFLSNTINYKASTIFINNYLFAQMYGFKQLIIILSKQL